VSVIDPNLRLTDFDYDLPAELIAQTPLADRAASRMLVVDSESGLLVHSAIRQLPEWLKPGDLIVANNTRVLPARLKAVKPATGARIEVLLLNRDDLGVWTALAKPTRKLAAGMPLDLVNADDRLAGAIEILEVQDEGLIRLRFAPGIEARLDEFGEAPLPPYIKERLDDPERYQTVFAREPGSAAAPTAGLHVTTDLQARLKERAVGWAEVTLHVGLDTFRPVAVERVAEHKIHREWQRVPAETAEAIAKTRMGGGRVIALGTTAARTLETLGRAWNDAQPAGIQGWTDIFITPGHQWRLVDGLVTNFHLPKSTLLMMVSSLAGSGVIKAAYAAAVVERYRFFSFGDAMLILAGSTRATEREPVG
jgi:S-adenosylmethionine:tRNA ribosyltransferase-isomerase